MSFTFNAVELCVALCSLSLNGLLQGSGCECSMMTTMMMMVIIGMMKIIFFFGTHQGTGIAVFLRMRKKKWKNCGCKYRPFVSDDWMQKLFDPKTTKNKDVFFAECF